ncbi:MAG: hypothetical protein H0U73_05175 [Tatlockia sp.]|nr:hypothetical protein [Tatlockia sp.]
MKKHFFFQDKFQDTKEGWFLPDEEGEKNLYHNYIYATQGGIVRLTPEMPKNFVGICTGWLQICLGLLIIGEEGKASIVHVTPRCNMQTIAEEIKWFEKISSTVIAYNPIGYNEEQVHNFIATLNVLLLAPIAPSFKSTKYGSIAYNRDSQAVLFPKCSSVGSSQWPLLRENAGLINDLFSQSPELRREFDGRDFQAIPQLVLDAEKIYKDNAELLANDTPQNRATFKNKLFFTILKNEDILFFKNLRPLLEKNLEQLDKILTNCTQAFFDYIRGKNEQQKDYVELCFGKNFDLAQIIDDLNQEHVIANTL